MVTELQRLLKKLEALKILEAGKILHREKMGGSKEIACLIQSGSSAECA